MKRKCKIIEIDESFVVVRKGIEYAYVINIYWEIIKRVNRKIEKKIKMRV